MDVEDFTDGELISEFQKVKREMENRGMNLNKY